MSRRVPRLSVPAMNNDICPFHRQAEAAGNYVIEDRAADSERHRPIERPSGPPDNND